MRRSVFQQKALNEVSWRTHKVVVTRAVVSALIMVALLGIVPSLVPAQGVIGQSSEGRKAQAAAGADTATARSDSRPAMSNVANSVTVPNLFNMEVFEAEEAVRNVGLYLSVTGIRDVVVQRPRAGTVVPRGSVVNVGLSNN